MTNQDPAPVTLEELARRALEGDRQSLDSLAHALQGDVYGLALRMLWNREDAEDATQEILVRIVTRLSQFGFKSRLKTWAYRVAFNYILDVKKSAIERLNLGFERFAEDLESGLQPASADDLVDSLLIDEVKVGCSLAMLQCLDRPHRPRTCSARFWNSPGPRQRRFWRSLRRSSASDCSTPDRPSSRSCDPTAGSCRTRHLAGATSACQPVRLRRRIRSRCRSRVERRRSRKHEIWSGMSTRRGGRSRCTARASPPLLPSTSLNACWTPSIRLILRSHAEVIRLRSQSVAAPRQTV